MTRLTKIIVLTLIFGAIAVPGYGYFQSHSFFNPEVKYREWFHETRWPGEAHAPTAAATRRAVIAAKTTAPAVVAEPVSYSDEQFKITEALWRKSVQNVEAGTSDWFDAEVVRQRAEVEEHAAAMDFLAWMYEHGQGIPQDYGKAYMWYERAKLAGETDLRGSASEIFDRLPPQEQLFAEVQFADDVKRMRPDLLPKSEDFKQINLRVFRQRRGEDYYRVQNERRKLLEPKPIHR